jgi:hypothetical protein
VDPAQRRSLAGLARGVPAFIDLLEAAARLGRAGIWLNIWRAFLGELNERQQLNWSEAFLDGSFAAAKKGAALWAKPAGGKARNG